MTDIEDAISNVVDKMEKGYQELPDRKREEPEITLEHKGDTPDGFPCYEIRKGDSWMHYCFVKTEDMLYISHVWMEFSGDFKELMNFVVAEHGTNDIKFTMVVNDALKEALHGFEEKQEFHDNMGEKATVLVGTWNDGGDDTQ